MPNFYAFGQTERERKKKPSQGTLSLQKEYHIIIFFPLLYTEGGCITSLLSVFFLTLQTISSLFPCIKKLFSIISTQRSSKNERKSVVNVRRGDLTVRLFILRFDPWEKGIILHCSSIKLCLEYKQTLFQLRMALILCLCVSEFGIETLRERERGKKA